MKKRKWMVCRTLFSAGVLGCLLFFVGPVIYFGLSSVPKWPSISDPDQLVLDAGFILSNSEDPLDLAQAELPNSISRLHPLAVRRIDHPVAALEIQISGGGALNGPFGFYILDRDAVRPDTTDQLRIMSGPDERILRYSWRE